MSGLSELFDMLDRVSEDDDWMLDALCAQTDPDMFFPEPGRVAQDAKTICTRCPVRQQCLTYAINNRMNEGIWGGLTPKQRTRVPREHRCDTCGASVRPGFRYCAPHGVEARRASQRAYDTKKAA